MRLFFNLPNRFISTVGFVALCLAFIFNITPADSKLMFYCAIIIFFLTSLFSGICMRMGRLDPIKNTINALWNFETACAFCYAFYLFYDYTLYGIKQPGLITTWARENPYIFSLMSVGLAFVAIFRASISITEIFKDSISKSKHLGASAAGNNKTNKGIKL